VVFRDESDFHAFAPALSDGEFYRALPNDLEPSPYILVHGKLGSGSRVAVLHELTHDLFQRNFGWSPPWLNEGWAEYFSTARIEGDQIRVGAALPGIAYTDETTFYGGTADDGSRVLAVPTSLVTRPSKLLGLDHQAFYEFTRHDREDGDADEFATEIYVGSWAFVHMLNDGPEPYPTRFQQFLRAVASGSKLGPAWETAFAGITPAQMDRDFGRYVTTREVVVLGMKYTPDAPSPLRRRTLSDPEVHLLWARLSSWKGQAARVAEADLDAAVAAAPKLVDAWYYRAIFRYRLGRVADAEADLAVAARLVPDDPRVLFAILATKLGEAKWGNPYEVGGNPYDVDRDRALVDHLARVAESATQLRYVAQLMNDREEIARGLDYARRAMAIAPIDPFVLDTYSMLLANSDHVAEAIEQQQRAISFLPDGVRAPELFEHLKLYEDALRTSSAK
jgi:tetratricopeptide (TPR) repeat protein